jgi:hypothetical protein
MLSGSWNGTKSFSSECNKLKIFSDFSLFTGTIPVAEKERALGLRRRHIRRCGSIGQDEKEHDYPEESYFVVVIMYCWRWCRILLLLQHVQESEKACNKAAKFDIGHKGWKSQQFLELDASKKAGLKKEHVIALRLYSSSSFGLFNKGMREKTNPHPIRVSVYVGSVLLRAGAGPRSGRRPSLSVCCAE